MTIGMNIRMKRVMYTGHATTDFALSLLALCGVGSRLEAVPACFCRVQAPESNARQQRFQSVANFEI